MGRFWCLVVSVILLGGCFGKDAPKQETAHDRVVGKIVRCEFPNINGKSLEYTGADCDKRGGPPSYYYTHINRRMILTIRTTAGTAIEAQVDADTKVEIGDKWPP